MNKYKALGNNLFGFEIFEEVLRVMEERKQHPNEGMFNNGIASAEAAVKNLRQEYYNIILKSLEETNET